MFFGVYTIKEQLKNGCKEAFINLYGWSGSISVIIAYIMTTIESDKKILIDIFNLYGSASIGIVCYRAKVWQAMSLEVIWFGIGIYSLIKNILNDSDNYSNLHNSSDTSIAIG